MFIYFFFFFKNCVVAVRNNWRWISTVLQCAQVHLHNAAAYQEVKNWIISLVTYVHSVKEKNIENW